MMKCQFVGQLVELVRQFLLITPQSHSTAQVSTEGPNGVTPKESREMLEVVPQPKSTMKALEESKMYGH